MADSTNKTVVATGGVMGPLWIAGWLFTLGFLPLVWWEWILALFIWPYYIGAAFKLAKLV